MNEFIVWDEDNNKFLDNELFENQIFRDTKGNVCWFSHEGITRVDNYKAFDYIEKDDSLNSKIYVDSSIVEFQESYQKFIGYFKYWPDSRRYEFVFYDSFNKEFYNTPYNGYINWGNIKIIDTIQENKLGLIKG